jgi:hypothetical protein
MILPLFLTLVCLLRAINVDELCADIEIPVQWTHIAEKTRLLGANFNNDAEWLISTDKQLKRKIRGKTDYWKTETGLPEQPQDR